MSRYFTAERIKVAIEGLGHSKAKPGLFDFLVVKRTFELHGSQDVAIAESNPNFMRATNELAACGATFSRNSTTPYFNVFALETNKGGGCGRARVGGGVQRFGAKPGDTVIDPYMGSGSTGIAAMRMGLHFIGIEINRDHYETAKARFAQSTGPKQPVQSGDT